MSGAAELGRSEAAEKHPLDVRLLVPAVAAWGGAWVSLVIAPRWALTGSAVAAVLGVALLCLPTGVPGAGARGGGGRLLRIGAAAVLVGSAASAGAALRVASLAGGPVPKLARDGATVQVEAVVTSDPRVRAPAARGPVRRDEVVVLSVRLERMRSRGEQVRVRSPVSVLAPATSQWRELTPGQRLSMSGRLAPAKDRDKAAALRARGAPVPIGRPNGLQRATQSLRVGLRRACADLPGGPRGLVPGLVVGDTSQLPADLVEDFRAAGLTHLTAVSGANVAILLGALLLVLRGIGLRGRVLPTMAVLALAGFVVLARPQPSVLRAAAMGLVALAALATGRRARGMPSLSAAVIALVLLDPWQARAYGFALSVIATAALLLAAPPLTSWLTAHGWPLRLAQALAVPVAASATTAPISVLLSGSLSLVAVPANLLAEPAVAPATVLGLLTTLIAPVSPSLGSATAHLAYVPAAWIVLVARRAAALPHATLGWSDSVVGAFMLAGVLLLLTVTTPLLLRRRWTRRLVCGAIAGVVTATVVQPPGVAAWPPRDWVMVACDVGQGDALVLDAGQSGAVVVDAGPDPRAVDRCLRDLGVRRIPLLLVSHLHADHVEGVPGVLHDREVAQLQVGPLDDPPDEAHRLAVWAANAKLPVVRARFGEQRSVGPLHWQVLAPQPGAADTGPNDASLVLLVRIRGITLLLTGDVEPPAQLRLRELVAQLRIDVLKVPHHGSAHQDPALLAGLGPRLALISAGPDNTYGHPAPETLAVLRTAGALVGRTDRDGDLAVVGDAGSLRLVRRGK